MAIGEAGPAEERSNGGAKSRASDATGLQPAQVRMTLVRVLMFCCAQQLLMSVGLDFKQTVSDGICCLGGLKLSTLGCLGFNP